MELTEVLRRVQSAEKFSSGWHKNIQRWRNLYDNNHYPDQSPKPGESQYTDPTFTNTVDLAVGILHSEDMIWKARGFKPTVNNLEASDMVEKAMAGFVDINSDREMMDLKHEVNLNFVRDGGAVIYSIWDADIHESAVREDVMVDEEGNQEYVETLSELPLAIKVIDPMSILLLPGGTRRWQAIMRKEQMTAWDVEQKFHVELAQFSDKSDEDKMDIKMDLIDYWDTDYVIEPDDSMGIEIDEEGNEVPPDLVKRLVVRHAIIFGMEYVRPLEVMEGYKNIPYQVNFYNPSDPTDSSRWHSILSPLESPVKDLETAINRRQRLINLFASMPLVARTRGGKPITMDSSLGTIVTVNAEYNEDFGFPRWDGSPPDVDKQIELYRSRIQQSGFSDVMFGEGPSGISGYALSQLGDQNRIRLQTAIAHLEDLWTWVARDWVDLVREFAPDKYMELYGRIRGDDFAEMVYGGDLVGFNIRCHIKAEFPNEKVRNHAMATQVKDLLSPDTIMENYLGIQQPKDEREKKLIAMAEVHPALQSYAILAKLQEMAENGDTVAQMVVAKEMQNVMAQPGGRPTEPTNPEQILGAVDGAELGGQAIQTPQSAVAQAIADQQNAAPRMVDGGVM